MQINNIPPNMNQMGYNDYYYNPNMNGYIPNDQNGNNMYYGNNNYYIPMAKMYPNNVNNGPYAVGQIPNHPANSSNNNYNLDKKL